MKSPVAHLDLAEIGSLNFHRVDMEKFPCLRYAYEACEVGGTMPAVVNGADEVIVDAFLNRKVGFMDIPKIIKRTMDEHQSILEPALDNIMAADRWARDFADRLVHQST